MNDTEGPVRVSRDERGVVLVTLNLPQRHNALSAALIDALSAALQAAAQDPATRVVVLGGEGRSFCAGADIDEMRKAADATREDNEREARRLAALLRQLDTLPRPTLARVQGNAFGGALGLVAACDLAIGSELAEFALSEVRLGIAPAMISPYLLRAIGERQARRYFLTGERFPATRAVQIGLLHQAVPAERLDATVAEAVASLLLGAPGAQAEAKRLVRRMTGRDERVDGVLADESVALIAALRAAPEGREGLAAFLEKRPPSWRVD